MRNTLSLSLYLAGLFLVFAGERVFGPGSVLQVPVAGVGLLLVLAAFGTRLSRWRSVSGESKRVLARLVPAYGIGTIGLLLYFAGSTHVGLVLSDSQDLVLRGASLVLGLAGTLSLVLMEVSLASMIGAPNLERRRILDAGRAGAGLAFALATVFGANFLADAHNERIDLRTVRNLTPSGATLEMVRNLSEPIVVTLAFPPANEVGDSVEDYFVALDDASDQLSLRRIDRDAQPSMAKELRLRQNGAVVVSAGSNHKTLPLDVDAGKARSKLKKLDSEFQKRLSKVSGGDKVAYFVADHGERSTSPSPQDPGGLKTAKKVLEQLGYKVKRLGLKEGLSDAVPSGASIVFLVGPQHKLGASERASLQDFVRGGGALMMLLEPDTEEDVGLGDLLAPYGLATEPGVLAHERYRMRFDGGVTDRGFIFTNSYGKHPSTELLSKKRSQIYVVARNAGILSKLPGSAKPELTLKVMPKTWADLDGDFEFDAETERRSTFAFGAAVELPSAETEEGPGGRAVIAMDADLIGDLAMTRQGNLQWFFDSIRWLEDEIELAGEVADLEDVRILHTEEDDALWFWGSTAGVPMLVLAVGLLNARRRRRT